MAFKSMACAREPCADAATCSYGELESVTDDSTRIESIDAPDTPDSYTLVASSTCSCILCWLTATYPCDRGMLVTFTAGASFGAMLGVPDDKYLMIGIYYSIATAGYPSS